MLPERIGRYEVRGLAGSGGFATVYEGFDPRLDARVAIKVLADNWSRDPEIRRRFRQEAVLLRRLGSERGVPGLVEVFDIDETDSGQPFFVMGWADRGTLADRAGDHAWEAAEVIPVIRDITQSLGHLHAAGVVHRDIKPQNLLLRSDHHADPGHRTLVAPGERIMLGDFGLAKDLAAGASTLSLVAGTERYMAPEQLKFGEPVDHRADIYAATAMVAELVAGGNGAALTAQLQGALDIGMAHDRSNRFASMAEWQTELVAALQGPDSGLIPAPDSSTPAQPDPPPPQSTESEPPEAQRPNTRMSQRTRIALGALAVVGIAVALVGSALLGDAENPILGPATIESGETVSYHVDGATNTVFEWTDPTGTSTTSASLEVTGRLPGQLTFSAIVDSEEFTRSVVVDESPDGPVIIGPESLSRGEQAVYNAAVPVGHEFFWIHPTRGRVLDTDLTVVQDGEQFVVGLVSIDADGIERGDQMLVTGG